MAQSIELTAEQANEAFSAAVAAVLPYDGYEKGHPLSAEFQRALAWQINARIRVMQAAQGEA